MIRRTKKVFFLIVCDLMLLYGALGFTLALRYGANPDRNLVLQHIFPFTIVFLLWLIFFGAFGFYDLRFAKNSKYFLYRLGQVMAINTVIGVLFFYLLSFSIEPRRNLFLISFFALIFIFAWRSLLNLLIVRTGAERILFVGTSSEAIKLADYLLANPQLGQRPVAFLSANGTTVPLRPASQGIWRSHDGISRSETDHSDLSLYNTNDNLADIIRTHSINTIIMLPEIKENRTLTKLLFQIIPLGIPVFEFSAYYESLIGKIPASFIGEVWFLENLIGIRKHFYEFFKRVLDLIIAGIISIPILLTFPLVALAIVLESPGPIFFRQQRMGKNGVIFTLLKYRSTYRTTVGPTEGWTKETGTIYTRVGRFIRKSYIDELPQIINIIKGEMSFIGPRPERPEFIDKLKQKVPFYEMRLLVPPGITGWAQVNMENDAAVEDAPEKMQYDLYYIKNRSFTLDLLIILRTIFILLQRQGR